MLCHSRTSQPYDFEFSTVSYNSMTDAQTFEVDMTLVPLNSEHATFLKVNFFVEFKTT